MPAQEKNLEEEEEPKESLPSRKRLFIIIIVVLAIIVLVPLGLIYGRKFFSKNAANSTNNQNGSQSGVNSPAANYSVMMANIAKDTDSDGLSDEEEKKLGIDISKDDTDSDGLSDFDEVKKYMTDPKKSDTDGDGYSDGDEVARGFNPKGEGKLLDLNRAISNQSF